MNTEYSKGRGDLISDLLDTCQTIEEKVMLISRIHAVLDPKFVSKAKTEQKRVDAMSKLLFELFGASNPKEKFDFLLAQAERWGAKFHDRKEICDKHTQLKGYFEGDTTIY